MGGAADPVVLKVFIEQEVKHIIIGSVGSDEREVNLSCH
ncbi:Unknown protein sequence [Pseudomonas amygdali pv. lachrymans]|nr:Unknown protein sequence [Pseudomonas amygdali pv. lachrymans]